MLWAIVPFFCAHIDELLALTSFDEEKPLRTTVQDYVDAFEKHYPTKDVKVKYRRKWDAYAVYIDGDMGDRLLSMEELQEATRMFNR